MLRLALARLERRVAELEADLSPPLGLPGGVEYTKLRIEEAIEDEGLESALVETLYKGESISNQEARLVYRGDDCNPLPGVKIFKGFCTSSHGQYRMDQRGISVQKLQRYFFSLEKYIEARVKITAMQPFISQVMEGSGSVKWTDPATGGLTVVFERRGDIAKVITAYYKDKEDPVYEPPKPAYLSTMGRRRRRR
jgi:hypothetical protein